MKLPLPLVIIHWWHYLVTFVGLVVVTVGLSALLSMAEPMPQSNLIASGSVLILGSLLITGVSTPMVSWIFFTKAGLPGSIRMPEAGQMLQSEVARVYGVTLSDADASALLNGLSGPNAPWVARTLILPEPTENLERYGSVENIRDDGTYYHLQLVWRTGEFQLLDLRGEGLQELPRASDSPVLTS